nr:MAG TPA: Dec protein, OB-Fold, Decoration, VIRAL PROTEIN [Caudoviricetes sp.]
MEDFQGKYNGKQIEQLLDKANDIDLSKYALKTDNAPTATKLQAARTIALSGAVTGSASSDFGSNITISTTLANFDASKITSGTIDIDRLPKAALERMVVVADDAARFKLTTATAQVGDTVKVTATNKMYLVKDDSKLNTEDGYEPYTASSASSVPWSGVTGKPSTFAPPTAAASTLGGVKVGYMTSGKNYKLQVDAYGNAFVNVPWTDNNTTYNQATADTLGLVKIGYSSSGKNYAVSLDSNGKMYVNVPWTDNNTTYAQATSDNLGLVKIGYSANGKNYPVALDGSGKMYVNVPWTDTNTTYSNMEAATSSTAGKAGLVPAPAAGKQASFLRGDGTWVVPTNTTYAKANTSTLGLVMIGYAENGKNYPVELDGSGKMYVNVPWTDTNTTYGVVGANGSTGLVKNGSTVTSASGYTACPIVSGVPYYKDTNTTYANMKAATASAAGAAGLVPAPAAGKQTSFLRGDGTWVVPTNTTYGLASTTANGLLRQLNGSTSSFMRGDGTWATPPNTTYAVANESTNGLMAAADKKTVNRLIGVNTVTTLANLPISKRSITATLSAATTLSVQSGMQIGEELMIRCVPSAVFTQAIPNSGAYVSMSGTSITTTANKPFEINIWCYASDKYSIAVKEQD